MTTTERAPGNTATQERTELLATLATHRHFLRHTAQGLTDEQARQRTTVSALTIGGLIKHVTDTEEQWVRFAQIGPTAMTFDGVEAEWADGFTMAENETLDGLLARYAEVAARTEEFVIGAADLNDSHPLPEAPWFEPGATWSGRRVLLHLIAETSQHSGHADIIRESLDGQKTMG